MVKRLSLLIAAFALASAGVTAGLLGFGPPFHQERAAAAEAAQHHPLGLEPPIVSGGLEPLDVERVLRAHLFEVRDCFDQAGGAESGTSRLELRLTLSRSGTVLGATAVPNSYHLAFGSCVEEAASHWIFPAPPQNAASVRAVYSLALPTQDFEPHPLRK